MALKGVNKARPDLRISASDTAGPGASNRGVERSKFANANNYPTTHHNEKQSALLSRNTSNTHDAAGTRKESNRSSRTTKAYATSATSSDITKKR